MPPGGLLLLSLVDGSSNDVPATRAQLDAWIEAAASPHSNTLDVDPPAAGLEAYFGLRRDHYIIVELPTMKIVSIIDGQAERAVDELAALLAR